MFNFSFYQFKKSFFVYRRLILTNNWNSCRKHQFLIIFDTQMHQTRHGLKSEQPSWLPKRQLMLLMTLIWSLNVLLTAIHHRIILGVYLMGVSSTTRLWPLPILSIKPTSRASLQISYNQVLAELPLNLRFQTWLHEYCVRFLYKSSMREIIW